jgi:hypothetical protein
MLVSILMLETVPFAQARVPLGLGIGPRSAAQNVANVKEQVGAIAPQSFVEVRLRSKEKVQGRLGEVTDQGFTMKVAQGDKILDRTLAFDEVKSVKVVNAESHHPYAQYVVLGALAGVVIVVVAVLSLSGG